MVLALGSILVAAVAPPQERTQWLRDNVVPVASIDPAEDDFSDLEPLVAAIGDARIVQLGESSHGAGATFSAKVRLIKFLHRRMGFDVLVWESGLYDLAKANEALRGSGDPTEAGQLGAFGIWSRTVEVEPLWRYASDSWASPSPLEMAGYDMQFSGSARSGYFDELRAFVAAAPDPEVAARATALIDEAKARDDAFSAVSRGQRARIAELREQGVADEDLAERLAQWRVEYRRTHGPTPEDLQAFREALTDLHALVGSEPDFVRAHSPRRVDFIRQTLINAREYGTTIYERNAADAPASGTPEQMTLMNGGWNRRDTRNAEIMRWLANDYYAGRKLIIWAHNGHIMNAYYTPDWMALTLEPQPDGMKPVGGFLDEQFGDDVYTIGFTAFEGVQRQQGAAGELPVNPAPDGSLEYDLHGLEIPHLFLDLRQLDSRPDHWLRQPSVMAIRGYMPEEMPDWTRVVDAIFYNDVMTPSHWIE